MRIKPLARFIFPAIAILIAAFSIVPAQSAGAAPPLVPAVNALFGVQFDRIEVPTTGAKPVGTADLYMAQREQYTDSMALTYNTNTTSPTAMTAALNGVYASGVQPYGSLLSNAGTGLTLGTDSETNSVMTRTIDPGSSTAST